MDWRLASEADLDAQIHRIVALVVIAEAAVVAEPSGHARAELRGQAHVGTGPGLVGHVAGQREGAGHADQTGLHLARIGLVVMVPRHFHERGQHGAAGLPLALQAPAERFDQRVALLAAEPHRGTVVAGFAVAVDLRRLPFGARERAGLQAAAAEPPAALEPGAEVRAVRLAALVADG